MSRRPPSRFVLLSLLVLLAVSGVATGCTMGEFDLSPNSDAQPGSTPDCEQAAYDAWVMTHGYEAMWDDGRVVAIPDPAGFATYLTAIDNC